MNKSREPNPTGNHALPVESAGPVGDRRTHLPLYAVFFLSGVAALIYEISWSRQIGLLFGHTAQAAAVVLTSFFAGMAIGHLVGAKLSSRVSPLIGYGIAELIVAGWAFTIPMLLALTETTALAPWLSSPSITGQTTARVLFSLLLMLPATIALGVTLPMMAVLFSSCGEASLTNDSNSSRVRLAYSLNTAGAFVGVLLATFYLLVVVGVRASSHVAAGLSVICAVTAFLLSRVRRREAATGTFEAHTAMAPRPSMPDSTFANRTTLNPRLITTLAALSGFGTMALQVLYTRMFSLVFHNSTYTFGIVIAVFLASLALSAGLVSRFQRRIGARRLVALTAGFGALATALSVPVFIFLTDLEYFSYGVTFAQHMGGAIVLVTIVVAPPIVCFGMLLPLVWTLAGHSDGAGRVVGRLTAVNTLAAAFGALSASFFLLVRFGLWESIALISILFFIAAFVLLWQGGQKKFVCALGLLFGATAVFALRSPVEAEYNRKELGERILQRWNSPYGWIDVVQRAETGAFKIRQNLHYRFGTTGSSAREYRQAHIPLLLHGEPGDVLLMGLGTGLTAGGAIPHQAVETIVVVELIPEVVQAARLLANHNFNVVDHPKTEIHIDDARHYLLANRRPFDLIISDLFVPWESQSGYLYTVEHYQIASQRLKSGGLFCQWLPLYQLGEQEFESIANSFASVFSNTTIWWGQLESSSPVIALIGTQSPLVVDNRRLSLRLNELDQNLKSPDQSIATTSAFWDLYIGDWNVTSLSDLNTDEHPRVEFLAPISNRDGRLIRGAKLERYYNEVLSQLPSDAARRSLGTSEDLLQRRARHNVILFGK